MKICERKKNGKTRNGKKKTGKRKNGEEEPAVSVFATRLYLERLRCFRHAFFGFMFITHQCRLSESIHRRVYHDKNRGY